MSKPATIAALPDDEIPALAYTGFGKLPHAAALMLRVIDAAAARVSLGQWAEDGLTFGAHRGTVRPVLQCALSACGLRALNVSEALLAGLATPFLEGMDTPHRRRALGDEAENAPEHWEWSDRSAHAVVLAYAADVAALETLLAGFDTRLAGWRLERCLRLPPLPGHREHFGFRDGISQPWVPGLHAAGSDEDCIPPGEVLLGHANAFGEISPPGTSCDGAVGRHGSYLVLRQLGQDVAEFWRGLLAQVEGDAEAAVMLAAKAMGRWPDGRPLDGSPDGLRTALRFATDPHGLVCPLGAHVRRANPRDSLLADSALSLVQMRSHRLLRRGRAFGAPLAADWLPTEARLLPHGTASNADTTSETAPRGMLFAALCANPAAQFELVQQTWLNNPKHNGQRDEVDPIAAGRKLVADTRRFSVPEFPFRRRLHNMANAVRVLGGGYFLLPGRSGLRALLR